MSFCESCPKKINLDIPAQNNLYVKELLKVFKGMTIGFELNSTGYRYFEENPELHKHINKFIGKNVKQIIEKLAKNEIDGAFGLTTASVEKFAKDSKIIFKDPVLVGSYFGHGVSVGIRKSDNELKKQINSALLKLIADGTVKKLSQKWFDSDMTP